jgi:hypothetical protein
MLDVDERVRAGSIEIGAMVIVEQWLVAIRSRWTRKGNWSPYFALSSDRFYFSKSSRQDGIRSRELCGEGLRPCMEFLRHLVAMHCNDT